MLPQQSTKSKAKGRRRGATRFKGIGELAAATGVTREHIYRVLTGERRSPHAGKWRMILGISSAKRGASTLRSAATEDGRSAEVKKRRAA